MKKWFDAFNMIPINLKCLLDLKPIENVYLKFEENFIITGFESSVVILLERLE